MIRVIDTGSKALGATRILFLRHAETAAPDRFHGAESDVGLGERGHDQAASVAQRLARLRPDHLFCSGMRRAIETARPIGLACGLEPVLVPDLHERRMGPLSGKLREEGWAAYDEARRRWMAGELRYTHPGGESYEEIRRRAVPALRGIAERSEGKTSVVVAHGVVIRVVLTSLLEGFGPEDFDRVGIEFVAINDLRYEGGRWRAAGLGLTGEIPPA